jgi:hypothetical protein
MQKSAYAKIRDALERDALLPTNILANGNWHWVMWDAKRKKVHYYKTNSVLLMPNHSAPRAQNLIRTLPDQAAALSDLGEAES